MTVVAESSVTHRSAPGTGRRIWNVVKLQFANRWNMIAQPWIVIGGIFVLDFLIWFIINTSSNHDVSSTGSQYGAGVTYYIFIYMLVIAVQAINLTFPFALGYSVTRRDYYLGTCVAFLIESAIFTAGYVILSYIESWMNGWGYQMHFFHLADFGSGPLWERLFTIFALFLFCFFVGTVFATMYVRWKMNGIIVLGGALGIVIVGAVALFTFTHEWEAVGRWFVSAGFTGVVAWSLVITVLAAVGGFLILRKATPRG